MYACCVFKSRKCIKKQYLKLIFVLLLFFELSNLIVQVSAYILIRDSECLTANKLSRNLTCSKHLYRFKVFLDPQWANLGSVVLLEVR